MLISISVLVVVSLRSYLLDDVDRSLSSSGKLLASLTVDQIVNGSHQQVFPSNYYLYIAFDSLAPREVYHSALLTQYGTPKNPALLANDTSSGLQTVPGTRAGVQWRVLTVDLKSPIQNQTIGQVVIAHHLDSLEATVQNVINILAVISLSIILAGGLIAFILIHLSLRRLRDIEQTTHQVTLGDLSVRVPPIHPEGSEIGMLGKTINEMLRTIEEAFKAKQDSERNMRRFVSDASHELRTPLATVRGYAELYRMGGIPEDQVGHAFQRVESEASRMATLVEDLLQLARLDEGRQLEYSQVELISTAMNAVSDFQARAPHHPAQVVSLNGEELAPIVINADHNRITQVLANLLGNVITHTPEGTPVELAVGLNPQDSKEAIIEVRDHGPGVSEEDRDRIFERFFRPDSSRSRNSGGSGLGLAIVAAICAAHGGTARVLETPGGGLTMRLTFPLVLELATQKARNLLDS